MAMRYAFLHRSGLAASTVMFSSVAIAAPAAMPVTGTTYLAAGSLLLTMGALAGLLVANRALRRELDRRGMEREHEQGTRIHVEQKLQLVREELERETQSKREELDSVQRQLDLVRAQLEAAEQRLDRLARVDDVTGIANRRRFDEALEQEIKRTIRERATLSVVLCEIDFFEEYARRRDEGHNEQTLVKVAQAIEEVFRRAGDLVARYSETRLAIILPATDLDAATRFGERVRKSVWDLCIPHEASKAAERLTVSVGVASFLPSKLHRAADLVTAAESALRKAHEAGHNRVEHTLVP
jgi:diguanylate cyclase (GGDEF)-like protein